MIGSGLLVAACSGGRPPGADTSAMPGAGGGTDSGAAAADGGGVTGDTAADGATGSDASDDATGGDGGPTDASSEPPGPEPPSCATSKAWTAGRSWVSDPTFMRFAGVASGELTVAWTARGGFARVADRLDPFSDFQPPADLPLPPVEKGARAALDASGNLLALVDADGTDFVVFERPSAAGAWAPGSAAPFAAVTAAAVQAGAAVSEPVFGASGRTFFFLLTAAAGVPSLYESRWDPQAMQWTAGAALPNPELASDANASRRPTGASSDDRTLFFYDEAAGAQRAAWRDDPSSPFTTFADVSAAPEAAPNAGCSTLYFQLDSVDAGGPGVFVAE